jgi:glutamate synthase (NADPH/NADH) large chain/glutamate synthase (ferredoxin)
VKAFQPISFKDMLEFVPSETVRFRSMKSRVIEDIRGGFTTAGMSLGALSREAHESLAIAMNRIGGKSIPARAAKIRSGFKRLPNGDSANQRIKQVASGRFGVHCRVPREREGNRDQDGPGREARRRRQLPATRCRLHREAPAHRPGVMLISPPPHHDIYSIEDLAQLIHDLKEVNSRAKVCVKLVANAGVGTVAPVWRKRTPDIVSSPATMAARARRRSARSSTRAPRGNSASPRPSRCSC